MLKAGPRPTLPHNRLEQIRGFLIYFGYPSGVECLVLGRSQRGFEVVEMFKAGPRPILPHKRLEQMFKAGPRPALPHKRLEQNRGFLIYFRHPLDVECLVPEMRRGWFHSPGGVVLSSLT